MAHSTIEFRSNIYPTSTKGSLSNDRKFLDAISDPEALDALWHYNGSEGSKLNPLQRRQHDMAQHCIYAEEGDFPWGTPVGSKKVVCLCENTTCPLYRSECSKYHPAGFKPGRVESPKQVVAKPKREAPVQEAPKKKAEKSRPRRKALSFVDSETVELRDKLGATRKATYSSRTVARSGAQVARKARPTAPGLGPWTAKEDAILCEMYPRFGITLRKWTKPLPGRSFGEIVDRAHELGVRYVPRREREAARKAQTKKYAAKPKAVSNQAAKKAKRDSMRARPWDASEDAIVREMYPQYGSNMQVWPKKLQYRTKAAIEGRAKKLGL